MNVTIENEEEFAHFKEMALRKLAYEELAPETLGRIINKIYDIGYCQGRHDGEKYAKEGNHGT